MRISQTDFEALVAKALDELPGEFAEILENVAVVVEEEPAGEVLADLGLDPERDELFGLYQGVPQAQRGSYYDALPDRVAIFRCPILRACRSRRQVVREVRDTLIHELGHHLGLEEEEMPF